MYHAWCPWYLVLPFTLAISRAAARTNREKEKEATQFGFRIELLPYYLPTYLLRYPHYLIPFHIITFYSPTW
ncbi:hypothetical protein V8F33_000275 [Rhypophila sp. PSN 637]